MTLKTGRGHHRKYLPYVFTEHGVVMAASVLNSPRAVEVSVFVVRAFVKLRQLVLATSWDWSRGKRYARIGARMTCDLRIGSGDSGRETSTSRPLALQVVETFGKVGMDD